MLECSLGISVVNGLAQGLELLKCLADRVIGIASLFIKSEPRLALVGHLLSERRQCRRYPATIRVPVENLVHAIPECHGSLLGLVEGLPGSDRIGREDRFGLGGLGGDAVDLRLVRDRGQPLLFDFLDPGQDFPLADGHDAGRRPSILVGLVELVHAGRALPGLNLDLLEDLGVGNELLGFLQFLGPQRGVFLGQSLGLVQSVHDLQPAIPKPGEVSLDLLVHREGLAADRLLEVRIFHGNFLSRAFRASSRSMTSTAFFLYCLIFDSTVLRVRCRASQIKAATIRPTATSEATRARSICFWMPACAASSLPAGTATWAPGFPVSVGATREFLPGAVTVVPCFATWSSIMASNDATASGYFPSRARGMNSCSIMASKVPFRRPARSLRNDPGWTATFLSSIATRVITDRSGSSFRPLARACLLHASLSSSTYLVAESGPGPADRTTTTK